MNRLKQLTNFNSSLIGSNPSELTDVNGVIYFTADDGRNGRELWKLEANNPPIRVTDINDGLASSNPENLTVVNGTLYFTAENGEEGRELWKINETGFAELVVDINYGANSSNPDNLTVFNNALYFTAIESNNQVYLNKIAADGNIKPVNGINSDISEFSNLTVFNDALYFTFKDRYGITELWRTNSTGSSEQVNGFPSDFSDFSNFNIVNNTLYFTAKDRDNDIILLSINNQGDAEPVRGISSNYNNFSNFTPTNDALYFTTDKGSNNRYVWKINSNGEAQRLNSYNSLSDLSNLSNLVVVNDILYFSGVDRYDGDSFQLWQIDNNGNTRQVRGTLGSYSDLSNFTIVNDTLYFTSDNSRQLWKIENNGDAEWIINSNASNISNLTVANNTLYFSATDNNNDSKLFKINNKGNAESVRDIDEMSNPTNLKVINDTLYFTASDKFYGNELWKIENEFGNTETAVRINEINRKTREAPSDFINVNGTLYFIAEDRSTGRELWRINSNGQKETFDNINMGSASSNPENLTVVNGTLYFTAQNQRYGRELWRINSNGQPETFDNINMGSASSNPENLTVVNGTLYFTAQNQRYGRELWKINNNGVPELVEDINNGFRSSNPKNFTIFDNTLYFVATNYRGETGLVKINSEGNVEAVRVINSGNNYSAFNPDNLIIINNTLYFTAGDTENGEQLWKINQRGDAEVVRDSNNSIPALNPEHFTFFNNTLYFSAENERYGRELWKINENGYSERITDIRYSFSNPENLTVINNTLYFTATDRDDTELWRINSDEQPYRVTNGYYNSSNISDLTVVKDTLYFTANIHSQGRELLQVDSRGDVRLLTDNIGNLDSFNPSNLTVAGDTLYFTATDRTVTKLWWVDSLGEVEEVRRIRSDLSNLSNFQVINDTLFFTVTDNNSRELWKVEGGNGDATFVDDINRNSGFSEDFNLTAIDNKLYFVKEVGTDTPQVWVLENEAPEIQLSTDNASYIESSGHQRYARPANIAANARIIDPDSENFNNGKLIVRITDGGHPDDRLGIHGVGGINLEGRIVKYRNTEIGVLTPSYGVEDMVIDFNANATRPIVERLLRSVTYSNFSRNPSTTPRTVELLLSDGDGNTSETVSKTVNVRATNDAPFIGNNQFLYDSSTNLEPTEPDSAPNGSWFYYRAVGNSPATKTLVDGGIQLTSGNEAYAGLSNYGFSSTSFNSSPINRDFPVLNRNQGYILSFNAEILSEDHTSYGNTDKNGDGKDDRAGFSVTLLSSDRQGIELGFWDNRIWVQQDGVFNTQTSQAADDTNPYSTLFTQVEGVDFDTTKSVDYDLAIFGEYYTLYADDNSILSGRLRNYSAYQPTTDAERRLPNPYGKSNFIFFGDNNAYAGADVKLGDVSLTTHPISSSQYANGTTSYNENDPATIISPTITLTDLDSENFENGRLKVEIISATPDERLNIRNTDLITVSGNSVLFADNLIGNLVSGTDRTTLEIRLNSQATPDIIQLLMRNITYENISENPLSSRQIEFLVGDGNRSQTVTRNINITPINDIPTVENPIANQTVNEDATFNFTIPDNTFKDVDSNFTLNATLEDDSPLPGWLNFNPETATFSGTPENANVAAINVKVIATDNAGESAESIFTLTLPNTNETPTITANQSFSIDEHSNYRTFVGEVLATDADGNTLNDWQILDGNLDVDNDSKAPFAINSETGEISVNDTDDIDFESNSSFDLQVTVSDGTNISNRATVTINLNDVVVRQINGTPEDDRLQGSPEDDMIDAQAGNDYLYGRGGNDSLIGGDGDDNLFGGEGNDSIDGGEGIDILRETADVDFTLTDIQLQGNGTDILASIERVFLTAGDSANTINAEGFTGRTNLYGKGGDDTLLGGSVRDFIQGGADNDSINGGAGNDRLYGETGNDILIGGSGRDFIYGGADNDSIDGGAGNDELYGETGNDTLIGGSGRDFIYGGAGNDFIDGGAGNDELYGEGGEDIFVISLVAGKDTIYDFEDGVDSLGLSNSLTFSDLTITADGSNTNIMRRNRTLATLIDIDSSSINQNDFISV